MSRGVLLMKMVYITTVQVQESAEMKQSIAWMLYCLMKLTKNYCFLLSIGIGYMVLQCNERVSDCTQPVRKSPNITRPQL